MAAPLLTQLPHKRLRAEAIAAVYQRGSYRGVVCFSSGNAANALIQVMGGRDVLAITPGIYARLNPSERFWWHPADVHKVWPDWFDGTPGHLPAWLMADIGRLYREWLEAPWFEGKIEPGTLYDVDSGSGETVMCLRMAYPSPRYIFRARYDVRRPETTYHEKAPLNAVVMATGPVVMVDSFGAERVWNEGVRAGEIRMRA